MRKYAPNNVSSWQTTKSDTMKHNTEKTAWICGAAAVVMAACGWWWAAADMQAGPGDKAAGEADYKAVRRDDITELVIGTYGENVYVYDFDRQSLEFTLKGRAEAKNASYALAKGEHIYAVSETGSSSGAVSFRKDAKGSIRRESGLYGSGDDPCFVLLHEGQDEKGNPMTYMMTADYSGGSVSMFPIIDGMLTEMCTQLSFSGSGPVEGRQDSSHIHMLKVLPHKGQNYILACDLGADAIRVMKSISKDLMHISDIPCPSGSGPRHMELNPQHNMLYCMTELSGEVLVYGIDAESEEPQFTLIQQIPADEVNAGGSADIHMHPSGKWLYTSHRLYNDGISIFDIKEDGTLEKTGYTRTARHPRNFMITEDGGYLLVACRDDRLIQTFRIGQDGSLTLTQSTLSFETDMPSGITEATE